MCAFSYVWSLPVTWQKYHLHHSIHHIRKPHHATRKLHGSVFCRTGVTSITFLLLWPWPWPDDLHIWTSPIFPGDIPDVQVPTSYVKAFESYRQTDRRVLKKSRKHRASNFLQSSIWSKQKQIATEAVTVSSFVLTCKNYPLTRLHTATSEVNWN